LGIIDVLKWASEFDELEKRKLFVLESIESQGKLTDDLKQKIKDCFFKYVN
jgi:transcriptional accessory protein Tex/SPT6